MASVLESLKLYFQNNSREQIEKDWAETEKYDGVGLKVDDFIHHSKLIYGIQTENSYWVYNSMIKIIKNPKFSSDFLFNLASYKTIIL
jgi:hypothetical protein